MSTTCQHTYQVVGMTCAHCVAAVRQEVGGIDGVTDVIVELASGEVTVSSTRSLTREEITAAVDEAGYELAP